MRKLAQFQELGHEVIFLIGTFTSLIGDPSDKTTRAGCRRREALTRPHTRTRPGRYWTRGESHVQRRLARKLTFTDIVSLASNFTVQQFLVRTCAP
jgi:tyrosyl-tRNA synthetase